MKFFHCILVLIFFTSAGVVFADTVKYDTVSRIPVHVEKEKEKKVFSREEYKYQEKTAPTNIFSDFFNWLVRKLFGRLSDENAGKLWLIIKIILACLFIGGIVYLVIKGKVTGLFKGQSSQTSVFTDIKEDITKLDIDRLIKESIETEDYRMAFRYSFLKSLQLMSNKQLIDWKPHKTNYEYFGELGDNSLRASFKDLYVGFEYVWYGDAEINQSVFKKYSSEFDEFNRRISV